jgi:hypothetical protein
MGKNGACFSGSWHTVIRGIRVYGHISVQCRRSMLRSIVRMQYARKLRHGSSSVTGTVQCASESRGSEETQAAYDIVYEGAVVKA